MAHVYLLAGEAFLAEEALARVRSEERTDPLSEVALGPDATAATIAEATGTSSLFGDRRLIVVTDAQDLKKDAVAAVSAYSEQPGGPNVLVIVASTKTKFEKAVSAGGGVVLTLEAPKGKRLAGWLRERGRQHDVRIDDRAAWALLDSVGSDLRELDGALQQLALRHGSGARIGADEVRRAFPRLADERTFVLTDAVGERRLDLAMTALRRLLNQGEEPLVIFGSLAAHLRRLIRARQHASGGRDAVAAALGMPAWRAEKIATQANAYRDEELWSGLQVLADTDLDMKGEFPSASVALERAVVKVVTGTR